jgi:hypothetical protein
LYKKPIFKRESQHSPLYNGLHFKDNDKAPAVSRERCKTIEINLAKT